MDKNIKTHYNNRLVLKMILTALFLALSLIFNFLGSKFFIFPLVSFLKFDISIVFILFACLYVGFRYGLLIILLMFFLAPIYGSFGYSELGFLGHGILAMNQLIFVGSYMLFKLLFDKTKLKNLLKWNIIINLILSSLITLIIMTLLNSLITTPLYFYLFKIQNSPSLKSTISFWDANKGMFLNINNYFIATFGLYVLFNLINLSLNSVLLAILILINQKTNFLPKI